MVLVWKLFSLLFWNNSLVHHTSTSHCWSVGVHTVAIIWRKTFEDLAGLTHVVQAHSEVVCWSTHKIHCSSHENGEGPLNTMSPIHRAYRGVTGPLTSVNQWACGHPLEPVVQSLFSHSWVFLTSFPWATLSWDEDTLVPTFIHHGAVGSVCYGVAVQVNNRVGREREWKKTRMRERRAEDKVMLE